MTSAAQFAKTSLAYFIGNVLSKLAAFLLVPLYTHYIDPADYGYYDVTLAYLNIFTSALFLDIWATILRFMFDETDRQEKYKAVYSGLAIMMVSFSLYSLIAVGFYVAYHIPYFFWIIACGIGYCWQNFYAYVARGFGQNYLFALSGMVNSFVMIGANIIFIVWLRLDYSSLYMALLLGLFAQTLLLESRIHLVRHFKLRYIDGVLSAKMMKYALPLCLNSLCYWFLTDYNRTVIFTELTPHENGIFAMAGKFSLALLLLSTCFNLAWQELAFSRGSDAKQSDLFYSEAGRLFLRFLLCGGIIWMSAVALIFPFMVDSAYGEARNRIPLYLIATIASIYSLFLGTIFAALKRTKIIFISTACACVVNVILLHSLIGLFRVDAAVMALLGGYMTNILIRLALLKKQIAYGATEKSSMLGIFVLFIALGVYQEMSYGGNALMLVIGLYFSFFLLRADLWGLLQRMRGVKLEN